MTDTQYRELAKEQYGSEGSIEIDDNAVVSRGSDPGAYVQAWVWVDNGTADDDFDAGVGSEDEDDQE